MIFTERFVYVHEPKTGGTFVTSMLLRLYGLRWTKWTHLRLALFGKVSRRHTRYGALVHNSNKHGGCNEVPASERGKKILATVRNPYDLYVSQYEFGWWRRPEVRPLYEAVPNFHADYPNFPDISFEQYVKLANDAAGPLSGGTRAGGDVRPGIITEQFLKFYFRDPRAAYERLCAGRYATADTVAPDMHDLHFVRTDQLNVGLYDFLVGAGYAEEDVAYILGEGKVLPRGRGRGAAQKWESYYTPELKAWVRSREELLFRLFPQFDVT